MWHVQGFANKQQAVDYQKVNGGTICWEERTPKTKRLTEKGKDYLLAVGAIGLDKSKYPYIVQRRV